MNWCNTRGVNSPWVGYRSLWFFESKKKKAGEFLYPIIEITSKRWKGFILRSRRGLWRLLVLLWRRRMNFPPLSFSSQAVSSQSTGRIMPIKVRSVGDQTRRREDMLARQKSARHDLYAEQRKAAHAAFLEESIFFFFFLIFVFILIFTCSVPNFLHLEACGITI